MQLASATDLVITTSTTGTQLSVAGDLTVQAPGSLTLSGSGVGAGYLQVSGDVINDAQITASGILSVGGKVTNHSSFSVQGEGLSFASGDVTNGGSFTFGNATNAAQLNIGVLNNAANAQFQFLPNASLNVAGTITNVGFVTFQKADFTLAASSTLNNSGDWSLTQGNFTNRGAANNASGGVISVVSGFFENQGEVTNDGEIRLSQGDYINLATTTNSKTLTLTHGAFQNQPSGMVSNTATGTILLTAGNYGNAGTTDNSGRITLSAGDLANDGGGSFTNRRTGVVTSNSGSFFNRGVTQNFGVIHLVSGNFENYGTLNNSAGIEIASGTFLNHSGATLTNQLGATVSIQAGAFENQVGAAIVNNGIIQMSNGAFNSHGTISGDGQLSVTGSATFFAGSMLEGNPTISATSLALQGTTAPGGDGIVGQMTFNAATRFQGIVLFDLVTQGSPGVGSDLIRMGSGNTGTLASGAQFDFHLANPPAIGDKYEIISGNVVLETRPTVTDDAPYDNRRIVLRTNQDTRGFSSQGTAYYALIARNGSFEQAARSNSGKGNTQAFGRYLDQHLPQDDHSIGTTSADVQWIRDTLDLMPNEADVNRALGQMAGDIYAPLGTIAMQRQFFAYNQLAGRLREDTFQVWNKEQTEDQSEYGELPSRGWITGYGFGGSIASDSNALGCSYGGGGLQAVVGYQVSELTGIGFFYDFGTLNSNNDLGNKADAQAHSWGGYVAWHTDADYCLLLGGGGYTDYHATRFVGFESSANVISRRAQGATLGGQGTFYGEYGRNLEWENAHLRPYIGLLYMAVQQNAFQETEAGGLNLSFDNSSINSLRTVLGGQFDFRYGPMASLAWTLRGVWMHEYINEAVAGSVTAGLAAIPDSRFTLARPASGTDWFVAGCGVRGTFVSQNVRPFANYDVLTNSQQSLHAIWGGVEYVW